MRFLTLHVLVLLFFQHFLHWKKLHAAVEVDSLFLWARVLKLFSLSDKSCFIALVDDYEYGNEHYSFPFSHTDGSPLLQN